MDTSNLGPEVKPDIPWVLPPENQTSYAPRVLGQSARESFTDYSNPRSREIAVYPGQSIQDAIDIIHSLGAGTIFLKEGTHLPPSSINIYSNVAIKGDGVGGSIIDFQNTSNTLMLKGTNVYNTGSVSVTNNGLTVTGSGITNWTSSMIGQNILLQDSWYEISDVTSTSSITLAFSYLGDTITGNTYTIADTIDN